MMGYVLTLLLIRLFIGYGESSEAVKLNQVKADIQKHLEQSGYEGEVWADENISFEEFEYTLGVSDSARYIIVYQHPKNKAFYWAQAEKSSRIPGFYYLKTQKKNLLLCQEQFMDWFLGGKSSRSKKIYGIVRYYHKNQPQDQPQNEGFLKAKL